MTINRQQRVNLRNRPAKPRILYQEWRHLLFLHWKYEPEEIQKTLPKGLYVDTFRGDAYLTIVPFFIQNLRIGALPALPFFSDFIEVNVRTYVYRNGIPGIWFYSLDINSLLATMAARRVFSLPYQSGKFTSTIGAKEISISGRRNKITMDFQFLPKSGFKVLEVESLDFFLLERYCLFSVRKDRLYRQRIHHSPYFISDVELKNCDSNLLEFNHFYCNQKCPERIHYCNALNVDFFPLEAE